MADLEKSFGGMEWLELCSSFAQSELPTKLSENKRKCHLGIYLISFEHVGNVSVQILKRTLKDAVEEIPDPSKFIGLYTNTSMEHGRISQFTLYEQAALIEL